MTTTQTGPFAPDQVTGSTMVRLPKQPREGEPPVSVQAREVFDALEPQDLVWRHQWLFAQHWVQESAEELHDGDFDFTMDLTPDESNPNPLDPSIVMDAMRKQLGLTLKSEDTAVDFLVIDSAQKVAAGN